MSTIIFGKFDSFWKITNFNEFHIKGKSSVNFVKRITICKILALNKFVWKVIDFKLTLDENVTFSIEKYGKKLERTKNCLFDHLRFKFIAYYWNSMFLLPTIIKCNDFLFQIIELSLHTLSSAYFQL